VQCDTPWLAPDALRLRATRLFTRTRKSFSQVDVRAFGYAGFSHGGPVWRLDGNGTWYVLASDVRADRVEQLLAQRKEYGDSLPVENIERPTASSLPKIAP